MANFGMVLPPGPVGRVGAALSRDIIYYSNLIFNVNESRPTVPEPWPRRWSVFRYLSFLQLLFRWIIKSFLFIFLRVILAVFQTNCFLQLGNISY